MYQFFMISRFRATVFFVLATACASFAQPERRSPMGQPQLSTVSFEAISLLSPDTGSTAVQVHYRIRQDFFVVLRGPDASTPYLGKGELIVELKDQKNNSAARELRSIILKRNSAPAESERLPDIQGAFTLKVPPGTYTVWFTLDDTQSERSFVNSSQTVTTAKPSASDLEISSPLLVFPNNNMYEVLNHSASIFFGENGGLLFNVFAPSDSAISVHYRLSNRTEYRVLPPQEHQGDSVRADDGIAALQKQSDESAPLSTTPIRYVRSEAPRGWKTVYVPLPIEKLYPGESTVTLDFSSGSLHKRTEHKFRVIWARRPLSLSNLDLAVDALQHIATPEEMEKFHTLSDAHFVEEFFNFWKRRDRDTTTTFNELMNEYYRRVDIANLNFSSTRETDGYKTDRGKIFILYGTPTNTERLFSPAGPPREVWTYAQLKKRFIFEDEHRTGMYTLMTVENL